MTVTREGDARTGVVPNPFKPVAIIAKDRDALYGGLISAGHTVEYARREADTLPDTNGALQMLARHRMDGITSGPELERLTHVIDRDRYTAAACVQEIDRALHARRWLREAGRGSYAYDDQRYQDEFGLAFDEILEALRPMRAVAKDKSDCTRDEEKVKVARIAGRKRYDALAALDPSSVAEVDQLAARIAEVISEDGGCWTACSGCQESVDGCVSSTDYPYNDLFKCQPGGGCSECGGIGVIWQDGEFLGSYGDALDLELSVSEAASANALRDVAAERRRQIDALGWTPDHDDSHGDDAALSKAAACYALAGLGGNGPFWITPLQVPQQVWPYRWEWKPKDRRTNLVRSAALIVAEIERLDRAALSSIEGRKPEVGA